MKPETISILELMKRKTAERKKRRQRDRGMWYCTHCDKMHGKRVVEYNIYDDRGCDSICSVGVRAWIDISKSDPNEELLTENDFYKFIAGKPCGRGGE